MTDAPLHYPAANDTAGIVVPSHPLSRRIRGWLTWALIFALLAWAWAPAEMFRVVALFTDWRNMAQFGGAFLKPNFHDWDHYLSDMIVTVQIAIWGTALAVVFGIPFSILSASQYLPAMDRAADPAADGRLPRDQRDRVRADVRRCGRPRSLRRRHGDFRSQSRSVLEALFRSGRSRSIRARSKVSGQPVRASCKKSSSASCRR